MKKRFSNYFAVFMALNILFEVISPTLAMALTNGSIQAEHEGFQQASNSEMVDLFTGDFNYNIPLLDVDGYPINISYQAGQKMEEEASWVGLGWSLNPGVMNRMMRGLPDDFNGDEIQSETNINESVTIGSGRTFRNKSSVGLTYLNAGVGASATYNFGHLMTYNNYAGHSLELQLDLNGSIGIGYNAAFFSVLTGNYGGGYNVRLSTTDGATFAQYKSTGHSNLTYPWQWFKKGGFANNSVQNTHGTVLNTKSGLIRNLYSRTNSTTSAWPMGGVYSSTKTSMLPVSALSFPPRISQSFSSKMESKSDLKGIYGCSPIWPFPVILEGLHMVGFPRYINTVTMNDPIKSLKAYGYMNLENAEETSLQDYNRFNDGVYMAEAPNSSYSTLTNDVFISSAQGMSSSFRAFRSDYGTVHDPGVFGFHKANTDHKGLGYSGFYYNESGTHVSFGMSMDGNWAVSPVLNKVKFYKPDPTSRTEQFYEKFFFKEFGEPTPVDATYEGMGGGEGASKPTLTANGADYGVSACAGSGRRTSRVIRNTHISYLNAADANDRALVKSIKDFGLNAFGMNTSTRELNNFAVKNRLSFNGLSNIDHHLSELTVTKDDGTRYVYGIPVYNHLKKTVIFNASDLKVNGSLAQPASNPLPKSDYLKMVEYTPTDASSGNIRGIDNFYNKVETPPYAQSFLLTSIISPDYVDLTGNGPSQDDLGTYILFNYTHTNQYEWRGPYNPKSSSPDRGTLSGGSKSAAFQEGNKSDDYDDRAVFEYGIRDNWYLNSIESKNYVAEFEIGQRDDNCGVTGDDGTLAPGTSYKLKQIRLFTKEEKVRAQLVGGTAVPLKTVTFEYDYSLCNGVYNGTAGKLTLKKIYITHENSGKMALSPYKFTYADNNHDGTADANPDYDPRAMDRWGSYKENSTTLSNVDFPYAEQDQTKADDYAASWNLTSIETPTGAKTDIYYEADDYSYVQDEPSAVMLRIAGFYSTINKTPSFDYSTIAGSTDIFHCPEALIDLEALNLGISSSMSAANASALVQKSMFPKKKQLFMKCKTYLVGSNEHPDILEKEYWEYVPCYATVEGSGIVDKSGSDNTYTNANGTFYKYAWIRLKSEKIENNSANFPFPAPVPGQYIVNPICKAGWEMIRTTFPKLAYPGKLPNSQVLTAGPLKTYTLMKASLKSAWNNFKSGALNYNGQNKRLYSQNYCSKVNYTESWVRAYAPYKKKIGDGHRVKKIVTRDNWNNTGVGEDYTDYGQEYSYTTTEGSATISSGVASYEPLLGGDENSLHQPIKFAVGRGYAPNDHYFQETPYLENLYPNAFVGYSKVTVRSIDHEYPNGSSTDKVCQVGKTVYEFHTAKEFPVIERKSFYEKINSNNEPIDEYTIAPDMYNLQYTSQGFAVKMNDMHGKLKSVMIYGENDPNSPMSGTTYYYKANLINANGSKELIQQVSTINENLGITTTAIGRSIDVTTDLRYVENLDISIGFLSTKKYSICNIIGKKYFFNCSVNVLRTGLGTASTTKVIQQYGILEKAESFNNKAKTTTENVLWDHKTGEVVLTKVTNNLDQPVYSFNYPAYWINKDMGLKYNRQNVWYLIDFSLPTPVWSWTGDLDPTTLNNILHLGDEVFIYKEIAGTKVGNRFWITQNPVNPSLWRFMDVNGVVLTTLHPDLAGNNQNLVVKIDRPIERNTQSLKIASVHTLHNPLTNIVGGTLPILNQKVINASAIEYCQVWDYFKQENPSGQNNGVLPYAFDHTQMSSSGNPQINPYSANQLGCWRPYKTYAYNDTRIYNQSQPNVKNDGLYSSYSPFYQRISGSWQTIPANDPNYDKWIKMGENSVYSPYSDLLETKDAQGISHVKRYGFNHTLPVLQASNARMFEVGFDSFEEYGNLYSSYSPTQRIMNDYLGFYAQMNATGKPSLTELQSHTGRSSLNFSPGQTVVLTHSLDCIMDIEAPPPPPRCDYMGLYKLNKPRYHYQTKYLVSFWLKSKSVSGDFGGDYIFNAQAKDPFASVTGNATMVLQKTKVINGWQKFDYEINFPPITFNPNNQAVFTISVPGGRPGFYLDDFRVQPYNSSMVCTVYDPKSLKPWAQMDDRNFATYLEYDNEGALVRGKKETVNGVFTVSETRKNLKK